MSIYDKYINAGHIDSGKSSRLCKKKYSPYHIKIQKKQHRFDQDYYWIDTMDDKTIEAGINKEVTHIDYSELYDWAKDGNG